MSDSARRGGSSLPCRGEGQTGGAGSSAVLPPGRGRSDRRGGWGERRTRRLAAALALVFALGPALPAVVLAPTPAVAVQPDEVLPDAALEARARALSTRLRCMVCQNQSIDDSDAPLARDLRILVRERLVAGDSDEAVIGFLVDRYGEFVLLEPRFAPHTLILWLAAPLVLVGGGLLAWRVMRRRPATAEAALTAEERRDLEAVLKARE